MPYRPCESPHQASLHCCSTAVPLSPAPWALDSIYPMLFCSCSLADGSYFPSLLPTKLCCRFYCERPDSGTRLTGGRLIEDVLIKLNDRPVHEIVAACCDACTAAAAKGCRKFWTVYTTRSNVAECQLRTAAARVVPCGPDGCRYNNGAPAAKEYFQTGAIVRSQCTRDPGQPDETLPVPPNGVRSAVMFKGLRLDYAPFKTINSGGRGVWDDCMAACAASFAANGRCKAFNFYPTTKKCELLSVNAAGKKVQYCTDVNVFAGYHKPSKM